MFVEIRTLQRLHEQEAQSRRPYPLGDGAISDVSCLEPTHSIIGGQRQVESLKTAVEEQVEGELMSFAFCSAF